MFLQAAAGACFNSKEEKIERQRKIVELCIATARGTDNISKYCQLSDMNNISKMVVIHIYTLPVHTHLVLDNAYIALGYNEHKISGLTSHFFCGKLVVRYDDYVMGITSLARVVGATTCIHSWGDITTYLQLMTLFASTYRVLK